MKAPGGRRARRAPALSVAVALAVALLGHDHGAEGRPEGRPEQVHASVHQDASKMILVWTTPDYTNESCVQYGLRKEVIGFRDCQQGPLTQFRHSHGRYDSPWIHEVTIRRLRPGKEYFYRVGGGGAGWSKTYSFVTRPDNPDDDVTFVALGDQVGGPCRVGARTAFPSF